MKAFRKVFILSSYLALGIMVSCEIEDEYSSPDQSEQLGTKVYTGNNPFAALLWSENTNEIIVVKNDGIVAIEAQSKKVRTLPYDPSYFTTQFAWLVGNTIYQLNTSGGLSRVDLTNLHYVGTLVDSVYYLNPLSSPFTETHFAYAKYLPTDLIEPSIFLYDLKSNKEIYVGSGDPYIFSSDGTQLVFSNNAGFHVYDLTTKVITSLNFNANNGPNILRWSTDGIISFHDEGGLIVARNESKRTDIGEWRSYEGLYGSAVSQSGKHIIAAESICVSGNTTPGYCKYGKLEYSIVDIVNNVTVPQVYTINSQIYLKAFSPDEKSFAFATYDHNVYISELQN